DFEPLGVFAKPEQIAPCLLEHACEFRRHLVFLDDYLLAHGSMIRWLCKAVKESEEEFLTQRDAEVFAEVAEEDRQQNKSCAKSWRLDVSVRFALTSRPCVLMSKEQRARGKGLHRGQGSGVRGRGIQ